MSLIYMCTLGQRPEAITLALDKLIEDYHYSQVVVLHTEPNFSGIEFAHKKIMAVLRRDYPQIDSIHGQELSYENGDPILDIQDASSASAYHLALLHTLLDYKDEGHTIHLMVAGGRKAMSIYATLAATLVLHEPDRVLTIISPQQLVRQANVFHLEPSWQHLENAVNVIDLPYLESRLLPGYMRDALHTQDKNRTPIGQELWGKLTKSQRHVAGLLERNPHASNKELAKMLGREESTIENHLRAIYKVLGAYYALRKHDHKRHLLIDILRERTY